MLPRGVAQSALTPDSIPGSFGVGYGTLTASGINYTAQNGKVWLKYTTTIEVASNFSNVTIWAKTGADTTTAVNVYIDELSVEKIEERTAPVLVGAQLSGKYTMDSGSDAVSIRFLGGVDSYENYSALGFRIAYKYSNTGETGDFVYKDFTTSSVYTSVLASENGVNEVAESINYGVKYFYTLTVKGIELKESGGSYDFFVTPVAIDKTTGEELVLETCGYKIKAIDGSFINSEFVCVDTDTLPTVYPVKALETN